DPGLRTRGPLGLGTEFESVRDSLPDDDVRQINWQATERLGRPMSNQYRIEQDRDVVCLLDAGRLMAAPLRQPGGEIHPEARITRLDAAVDAVTMVALVADELGDRCGVTIYDSEIRRRLAPRRAGGKAVIRAVLDVEPRAVDSDHDLAFRAVGGVKRALVIVCTDLVDEAAARSLLDAVPVLARRHAVVVASAREPDLDRRTRFGTERLAPRPVAGVDERPPHPQAGRARHDDAAQLQNAVRGDELEKRTAVARTDREAADHAEHHAVLQQHPERADAE